jgi:predicted DNA-binding transcriptional regulator AlpA
MLRSFENLVGAVELRSLLRISESTLRRWISLARLPVPMTIGRKMFWHEADLEDVLRAARPSAVGAQIDATRSAPAPVRATEGGDSQ